MNVFLHLKTSTGGSTGVSHEEGIPFFSAEALSAVAVAAEEAGFHGVYVTDHPFPTDESLNSGMGHQTLDPLVPLSVAVAVTKRLRVCTHVYILPYRNPFLIARAMSSLDVVSGGRLVLGVGPGYMEGEFEALGVDFAERNELMDEAIRAMKSAWSEESIRMEGRHFRVPGNTMLPRPVQKPHPPIYVGGNSKRAARRAGELGDGFAPFLNPAKLAAGRHTAAIESLADLKRIVDYAQSIAKDNDRPPLEIGASPMGVDSFDTPAFNLDETLDYVKQLRDMGAGTLYMGLSARTYQEQVERIRRFGKELLPHLAAA